MVAYRQGQAVVCPPAPAAELLPVREVVCLQGRVAACLPDLAVAYPLDREVAYQLDLAAACQLVLVADCLPDQEEVYRQAREAACRQGQRLTTATFRRGLSS
jgi:hypothetical protein